jgi:Uncharacterized conserved protein
MLEMEKRNAQALDTTKYVVVRLDGQNFHSYHKHFGDHFSDYMQDAMNYALLYLMEKVPYITFGYTNSDEITVVMKPDAQYMNNRVEKIVSLMASYVTGAFNQYTQFDELAGFDARVFVADTKQDALDALSYRQEAGKRNSVNTYARQFLTKQEMKYQNPLELETILTERGVPRLQRNGFYYGYFATNRTLATGVQVAHGRVYEIADLYL